MFILLLISIIFDNFLLFYFTNTILKPMLFITIAISLLILNFNNKRNTTILFIYIIIYDIFFSKFYFLNLIIFLILYLILKLINNYFYMNITKYIVLVLFLITYIILKISLLNLIGYNYSISFILKEITNNLILNIITGISIICINTKQN